MAVCAGVGVEQELLLLTDAEAGEALAVCGDVIAAADRSADRARASGEGDRDAPGHAFEAEHQEEQVEFATKSVTEMEELQEEIVLWRVAAARHAATAGALLVAPPPPRFRLREIRDVRNVPQCWASASDNGGSALFAGSSPLGRRLVSKYLMNSTS
ncbi:hypothetical protein [Streptomyces sp. NPDC006463]|uniref:hypothetical protein n=1 Tax=Streptomyces sp. NPDC006463 TaxID=3364746 RepID=UPI0036ABFB2F